jgi:hypothetical protein
MNVLFPVKFDKEEFGLELFLVIMARTRLNKRAKKRLNVSVGRHVEVCVENVLEQFQSIEKQIKALKHGTGRSKKTEVDLYWGPTWY